MASEGSSERVHAQFIREIRANRIQPDVKADGLEGFSSSEDVVEEFLLPERGFIRVNEFSRGTELEGLYEVQEIGICGEAFNENVKVIGHKTVGVDGEVASCGGFAGDFARNAAHGRVCEVLATAVATESDEDCGLADVVFRGETDILMRIHYRDSKKRKRTCPV